MLQNLAEEEVDRRRSRKKRNLVTHASFDAINAKTDDAGGECNDDCGRLAEKKVPQLQNLQERQLVRKQC